ncbi:MAG TPA: YkgJ family cysteine cluster protein [Syntrophales bacterium]|nr:YkgJ family cysteine cluster protein [Syntrophales bacterium]
MVISRNVIFTKIKLPRYDIIVPFVCGKCGTCCMTYIPRISAADLMIIAQHLKWPAMDLLDRYTDGYLKRLRGRPGPCLLLDDSRLCRIYDHPLRPDACRLYPFSYEGTDADCDAYLEHERVVESLLADEKHFEVYDVSFCPDRDFRLIPDPEWPNVRRKLERSAVSRELIRAFLILNKGRMK